METENIQSSGTQDTVLDYNFEDLTYLKVIEMLDSSKLDYENSNFELENMKAKTELTINWNEINEERYLEDLPKISNAQQRSAYIHSLFADREYEVKMKYLKYQSLKRIYQVMVTMGLDCIVK